MSLLQQLQSMTTVVADTGDINAIVQFKPTDATTNPSLLLTAAQMPQYRHLVDDALAYAKRGSATGASASQCAMDKLIVNFGREILKIIPGRVSTEVDARLSYDTQATIEKAKQLIALYEEMGISKQRILIKIASTWQGIEAAKYLEKECGIHCNLTLLFSLHQAACCAAAAVTLISPFVGRITDWYKKREGKDDYPAASDPGVRSVKTIYKYLKHHGYRTVVMGASFRNIAQIEELAGIDFLTISPKLLSELESQVRPLARKLKPEDAMAEKIDKVTSYDLETFKRESDKDDAARELLADGIRRFDEDAAKLEAWLKPMLS